MTEPTSDKVSEARQYLRTMIDEIEREQDYKAAIAQIDNLIAAVRAEQPPAIGHVANCRCNNPISSDHSCKVCYEPISANVPDYTDPRCEEFRNANRT